MFGNKKKEDDERKKKEALFSPLSESLQKNNFNVAELPVHTMKSELKNLEVSGGKTLLTNSESSSKKTISKTILPIQIKKDSPAPPEATILKRDLISPADVPVSPEATITKRSPIQEDRPVSPEATITKRSPIQEDRPVSPEATITKRNPIKEKPEIKIPSKQFFQEEPESESNPGLKKLLFIPLVILIILILAGGGYYFWITRMENSTLVETPTIQLENTSEDTTLTPLETISFSETNANYLNLDIENSSIEELRASLKEYAVKVLQLKSTTSIEFLVTDKLNNPIPFQDFAQKIGIILPQSIISQLSDSFKLYIYLENNTPHIGLAIYQKNTLELKKALEVEESKLPLDLEPLFSDIPHAIGEANVFNSSTYLNNQIRYTNIISPEELSIDYTISDDQLMIATTKLALRDIIDRIQKDKVEAGQ